MNTQITADQIKHYREDGFVVLQNVLDAEELADWRTTVDDAVGKRLAQRAADNAHEGYYAQVFTQCLRMWTDHAGIARLVTDGRLGKLAAELMGVDGVRLWHDQALIKPPYGNQTAWHLDLPYWAFESPQSINMWFPLEDATLSNGCLWYLPGTHLLAGYQLAPIGQNLDDLFKIYPDWKKMEAVPAPCPAGGVVIHNGLIAHAAGANMTPRARRAMTAAYFPDGMRYKGHTADTSMPQEYYDSLSAGDLLNNDRYVPHVWSK